MQCKSRPPRGGRGLKSLYIMALIRADGSPPSRGAWIEIYTMDDQMAAISRRPPRGGRGLKYGDGGSTGSTGSSRPPRGGRGLKS